MLSKAAIGALLLAAGPLAHALTVFACEPEWAALTRALMPQARILTATTHLQDPHHIEARPALIAQLRSAQLAVCTGASLEAGWLPMLQQRAGNPAVQDGQPGMFYAAQQVDLIEPNKASATPFAGDVHAEGNPHVHADPHRLLRVAQALRARLAQLEPAQAEAVDRQYRQFEAAWTAKIADWERRAAPLKGRAVAAQHTTFGYLWRWLGLRQVVDLEPKPGMPPTPGHLDKTLASLKSQPVVAIVIAPHQDPRAGRWLAQQLGRPSALLVLPSTVTDDQPDALVRWMDQLVTALAQSAP